MALTWTFYGASDDLIEVDCSDRSQREEYGAYSRKPTEKFVHLTNGTVVGLLYDAEGYWRARLVAQPDGVAQVSHFKATDPDRLDYSDKLVLTTPEGVTLVGCYSSAEGATEEDVLSELETIFGEGPRQFRGAPIEKLRALLTALRGARR